MKKYLLVTDATAGQVERRTGLKGHDTPFGALVEDRDPIVEAMRLGFELEAISRAFNPPQPRGCPECHGVILHRSNCRLGMAIA